MKLCVLGDSHTGALKRGWDKISQDYPDISITFFASRGGMLRNLFIRDGELVTDRPMLRKHLAFSSGGHETVQPEAYDRFLIYGLKAKPNFIAPDRVVSAQLKKVLIEDLTRGSVSLRVLSQVKKLTDKPVYVGHAPLIAAEEVEHRDTPEAYIRGIQELNDKFYAQHNCQFIGQPISTIVNSDRTDVEFSKGSKRLHTGILEEGEEHPEEDNEHMNDEYGALWMRAFVEGYLK